MERALYLCRHYMYCTYNNVAFMNVLVSTVETGLHPLEEEEEEEEVGS